MSKSKTEEGEGNQIPFEEQIRTDEEDPDLLYQDEMRNLRRDSEIQRLSHRITLVSIVVPCLLFAILVFAYFDLSNKLDKTTNVRSKEVQTLSEDVVNKIASLSQQYKKLEGSLIDGVSSLEKSSASIKQDLKRNERAIKKLTVSKIDKKVVEKVVDKHSAEVAETLAALRNELHEQKQSVEDLGGRLKKEMAAVANVIETMQNEGEKEKSAIKDLSEHKVDKEDFDDFLKKELANYQKTMELLQRKIGSVEKEIAKLQKRVKLAVGSSTVLEAEGSHPEAKPASEITGDAPTPVPAKIIEQDVTQ